MRKIYKTPEFDVTKFELNKDVLDPGDPDDAGNVITQPWAESAPEETLDDFDW